MAWRSLTATGPAPRPRAGAATTPWPMALTPRLPRAGPARPGTQFDGAYAGQGQLVADSGSPGSGGGSFDTAIDIGNNGTGTFNDGAVAGAGGLVGLGGDGNHDVAIDFGN